jgi:hypothetical protein
MSTKTEIIEQLEELLKNEDVSPSSSKIKSLQKEYESIFSKELEAAREEFINEGGKAREFTFSRGKEDETIIDLLEKFRKLKKQYDDLIAKEQEQNFKLRKEIIQEITAITQLDVNIGSAIKKLRELQQKWKDTGNVSTHKYKELQAEYSKAVEDFYYNVNIFRQLQDHDLKRNYDLKTEVIQKMTGLQKEENIKEVEQLIKVYRNDWEEIGPVPNDKWEELKTSYRSALEETYSRLKQYYKEQEALLEENLQRKKDLVEFARKIVEQTALNEQQWKEQTEKLLEIQNQYKSVGRTDRKSGDEVWRNLRELMDEFFEKKKNFYSGQKEKNEKVHLQRLEIIKKAEALKDSTDWKETAEKLIQLQNLWKKIPSGNQQDDNRMFMRFRKICNVFFDARKAHFDTIDAGYAGNQKLKEELISQLKNYVPGANLNTEMEQFRKFREEWNAIGHVPLKEKKRLNDEFFNQLEDLFGKLHIEKEKLAEIKYQNKLERIAGSDPARGLEKELDFIRKQISEINASIARYENNLGFFKHAKTKNEMMLDIERKIEAEKSKIDEWKSKQKAVSNLMASVKRSETKAGEL